ncbi:hypothetical protein DFQ27_000062 [Actinomortierella ambigua]|uniref:F-box domain-containing protein n=1 Tax=Actinomortierella ambigua TaxID=1343610 RepID=A0A9P6UCG6_9FUNG|nr:hypothetical protein DFQ27_000062 [Actinomortierella ambigua]
MPIEDLITLPHVAKGIALYSSRTTLSCCSQVSKAFYQAFTPHLWLHVERSSYEPSPVNHRALSKYGRYIRSANLRLETDILSFAEFCPNLTSLASPSGRLNWKRLAVEVSPQIPKIERLRLRYNREYPGFADFLTPLKNLRSLVLQYDEHDFPATRMATILTHCHRQDIRLELFEMRGTVVGDRSTVFGQEQHGQEQHASVINSNDALVALNLDDAHLLNSSSSGGGGIEVPATLKSFLFKDLKHHLSFNQHAADLVLATIQQCPALQEISLPELDASQLSQIYDWLSLRKQQRQSPTLLTAIHFGSWTRGPDLAQTDKSLADLVLLLPQNTLRQLTFRSGYIGTQLLKAILNHHARSIEVLDIGGGSNVTQMTSSLARAFLSQCPSLTVFKVGQGVTSSILSGQDAMNDGLPWACQHLEVLQLSIGGFCLQSNNDDEEGPEGQGIVPCQTHDACLAQERQVMQQLGRLRSLYELDTSLYPRLYPAVQDPPGARIDETGEPPHLAWTIAAGLDLLAPLKDLKLFRCYGVEHKTLVEDVKWMKRHWPKLQDLSCGWDQGLFGQEISDWLQRNWVGVYEHMALLNWLE